MKIAVIFGTRPEAIKLCPLVLALREHDAFEPQVCVTAQHRAMLDQVLDVFGVQPDVDLDLMLPNQTLPELTSRTIQAVDAYLGDSQPDWVIVQGDTTTVFCAALAAYYRGIKVAHVEAGLRTYNKRAPFPEEMNRVLTTHLSDLHFAPTGQARVNLLREGVAEDCIHVTGNTVIDALQHTVSQIRQHPPTIPGLPDDLQPGAPTGRRIVLITGHRRENFGAGFRALCDAIRALAERHSDCAFIYPVHLNPNVQEPVHRELGDIDNVYLIEPLAYPPFVAIMNRATLILTDSGGIQEEAPSLGKPVLVMRDKTERPEAVEAGTVRLVRAEASHIVDAVTRLLTDRVAYEQMARAVNPYGDGKACARIIDLLLHEKNKQSPEALPHMTATNVVKRLRVAGASTHNVQETPL